MKTAHVIWGLIFCFAVNMHARNESFDSLIVSKKQDQDSSIIYTVEYRSKPASPPTPEPEHRNPYLRLCGNELFRLIIINSFYITHIFIGGHGFKPLNRS